MKSLQTVMLVNAVSSGATGLLLIVLANLIAQLMGTSAIGVVREVGFFLVAFAGLVFYESRRNPMRLERVRFIVILDCLWVLTSLVVVLVPAIELSILGRVVIVTIAAWVGLMAWLQATNLGKITG